MRRLLAIAFLSSFSTAMLAETKEVIRSSSIRADGIEFTVVSHGCTLKERFRTDFWPACFATPRLYIWLLRTVPDNCTFESFDTNIFFTWEEMGVPEESHTEYLYNLVVGNRTIDE